MKKNTFLLFLLTSFMTMFGQTRNIQFWVVDANGSRVTCPANTFAITNSDTSVTTNYTLNNGGAFVGALTVGVTYTYDAAPPLCYTNQTHSTGSFVPEAMVDMTIPSQTVNLTPFVGAEVSNTVSVTVNVDAAPATASTVVKLYRFPTSSYTEPYIEIIGTNTAGVYSFANVPFGAWNLSVQPPCAKTQRYTNATTITCTNYSVPIVISTKTIITTPPGSYSVYTGPTATGLKVFNCTDNYPMGVSGGNIVDDTDYTVNYTYDNWGTPVTVTSPIVRSFPTYNKPPFSNNNNNRLQFTPEGYNGSAITVNFLTQVGGSCPDLVIGKSSTILGPPQAFVSFNDTSLGWSDPSSILSGTLTNDETGQEYTDYAINNDYGTSGFSNIPQGTYTAKLNLTNCRVNYTIPNIVVTCESILAGTNTYSFDGSTVPAATSGKVVARMVTANTDPNYATCTLPVYDGLATATMTDGTNTVVGTLTYDSDFVFENVPFSGNEYTITSIRPCYANVTAKFTPTCANTWYSVQSNTGDPCYQTATENGYGYTTLNYSTTESAPASNYTVVMDMPFGEAYFSKATLSGFAGSVQGDTSVGNFANFTNVPYGNYTLSLERACYNQKVVDDVAINCAVLTAAAADTENPFGNPYTVVTYTNADKKSDNYVIFAPMVDGKVLGDATITITSTDIDPVYTTTDITYKAWDGTGYSVYLGPAPFGNYTYTITADCYDTVQGTFSVGCNNDQPVEQNVDMTLSTTNNLDVNLAPIGGIGFGVYGATIRVYNADYSYDQTTTSSDFNTFAAVPYGEVTYEISQSCKQTVTGTTTISCNDGENNSVFVEFGANKTTNDLDVNLAPIGGIGFGVYGATIRVYNADYSYDQTTTSSDFNTFAAVPYGEVTYEISQSCKQTVTGTTTISCNEGENNSVFVEFGENLTTGQLDFGVSDGMLQINGATIHVYNADKTFDETIDSTSDINSFFDVPYGEVTYVVSAEGYDTYTGTVTIACQPDNFTFVSVVLQPALGVADFNKNTFDAVSFPNPFANNFAIKLTSLNQDKVNIKVYDMVGRLVEQRNANVSDLETTQIGNNYPSGIYNVVVTQDKNVKTLRVIKR